MLSRYYSAVFFLLIFLFIFCFFTKIHPLYVFDTDDWAYIQDSRAGRAWPLWGVWNPTRVFPEIFMPIVSWISVIIVYPCNNDYIEALSLGFGFTLTFFVVVFAIQLAKFFEANFKLSRFESLLFCLFYILFLFYPLFRHRNTYLLRSVDVTCVFYYTIPALLNATVVLLLISVKQFKIKLEQNYFLLSVLICSIYFSLNSNLFQSIILFSYVFTLIIFGVGNEIRKANCFRLFFILKVVINYLKNNKLFFIMVVFYSIVLFFEQSGERASGYSTRLFDLDIKSSINVFFESIDKLQRPFHFLLLTNLFGLFIYFYKKRSCSLQLIDNNYILLLFKLFVSFIITISFLILLCSKTGVSYLQRTDVILSYFIYILLISLCSVIYIYNTLIGRNPFIIALLPLFVILLLFRVVLCDTRYAETSMSNFPIRVTKKISDDIISQIISADSAFSSEIEIHVPKFSSSDNMPLALYGSQRVASALYNHRLIDREVRVKFIPDISINCKYKSEWIY